MRYNKLIKISSLTIVILAACINLVYASNQPKNLYFDVFRNGDKIGYHRFSFNQTNSDLNVNVKTNITVDIAFITVFRYEHERSEKWKDNSLISFAAKTHDDGTDKSLNVTKKGSLLEFKSHSKKWTSSPSDLPVTFWNIDILKKNTLFSVKDGKNYSVSVKNAGSQKLNLNGNSIDTTLYEMRGELNRDLWYDTNNQLVKISFTKDDSKIDYIRK